MTRQPVDRATAKTAAQRISTLSRTVSSTDAMTENRSMARHPGPPPRGRTWTRLFLGTGSAAVVVVALVAAGLRETPADHVADGEDGDVQPRLVGAEALTVLG